MPTPPVTTNAPVAVELADAVLLTIILPKFLGVIVNPTSPSVPCNDSIGLAPVAAPVI